MAEERFGKKGRALLGWMSKKQSESVVRGLEGNTCRGLVAEAAETLPSGRRAEIICAEPL